MRTKLGQYIFGSLFSLLGISGYQAAGQLVYYNNGVPCTVSAGVTVFMEGSFVNQTAAGVDGSFDNQGTISITEDWINDATLGGQVFSSAAGTVQFLGTANAQTIGGTAATAFFNATFNNTFATSPQLALSITTTVRNTLTMTSGVMNLGANDLTLGTSVGSPGALVHSGTSASGWLFGTGRFIRWFATGTAIADGGVAGLLPLGTSPAGSNMFRPIYAATAGPAPGGTISAFHTDATTTTDVSLADGASTITRIHDVLWDLVSANGIAGTFDLRAEQEFAATFVGDVNDLRLTPQAGVVGTAGVNGGTVTNPIVRRTGLTAAQLINAFHVATVNVANSPLPITLVYFEAKLIENKKVELTWETETEHNNDYFVVERSKDGTNFTKVGTTPGSGNSSEPLTYSLIDSYPLRGTTYYRLLQVDLDGLFAYSGLVAVSLGDRDVNGPQLFPNPLMGLEMFFSFPTSAETATKEISWIMHDVTGREVDSNQQIVENSGQPVRLPLSRDLAAGFYVITITYDDFVYRTRLRVL